MTDIGLNQLSSQIIKAAMTVHSELGPGLLESVYNSCMVLELNNMGIHVKSEVPLPVTYRGQVVSDNGLRLDLVVEDTIVVELKSVEQIQPVHLKQVLTYVRLAKKPLGLLINFNELHLKDGIHRIVNSSRSD
jgi:GxxExxY protein